MKITITTRETKTEEVEVSVPWYRVHDMGGDEHSESEYTKIYEDPRSTGGLRFLSLTHRVDHAAQEESWGAEEGFYLPDFSGRDYMLGLGRYQLSAEGWEEERAEMEVWLRKVGVLGGGS